MSRMKSKLSGWKMRTETKWESLKFMILQDEIPLFDLRIADMSRGNGYGPKALRLVAEYVFGLPDKKIRLEGHTRQDNLAMRKTFERAGFVKEAHLRKAWFSPKENSYYDAVTYGITREDFMGGTTTPVIWEDGRETADSSYSGFPRCLRIGATCHSGAAT